MRYTGARNRIARREGIDLGLKTAGSKSQATLLKKLTILPGQHGTRGRRKISEHATQLREKQKLRYLYGVTANQLKNYFAHASRKLGNTAFYLTQFLESRLDNVVYKLGFAPTRSSARQLVNHRHIIVNGRVVDIPSYQVKMGDVITLKEGSIKIPYIEKNLENKDLAIPKWLERQGAVGKVIGSADLEDVERIVNLRLVVEFFSR